MQFDDVAQAERFALVARLMDAPVEVFR